ncbi:carbohydrate kinase FGGY [Candidatus Moduliflexus flocculans]|uniref:Carbohydrate kinase FGGY n=1 Tax=Candidatus Moduliflexus flocculans TaxID=1499966 RepID=A0A081BSV9_9BACT|nr:carbohydrate kinase FGGY [Candidatus Moduliflexus flocculans]
MRYAVETIARDWRRVECVLVADESGCFELSVRSACCHRSLEAALLAGIGVGVHRDEKGAFQQVSRPGRIYAPNPEQAAQYEECYPKIFTNMYSTLAPLHHKNRDVVTQRVQTLVCAGKPKFTLLLNAANTIVSIV